MKRAVAVATAWLTASVVVACAGNPVEQGGDPAITLSEDSVSVVVGGSTAVVATVLNTREPAQFASRDESVAKVFANGAISGVGIGTTYVVAMLPSNTQVRDSIRVRVQAGVADTCVVARPDFGLPATQSDLDLFAYDVNAPLNLQTTVDSTKNGVEVSTISFTSPDGGSVPGSLVVPVGRSGLRPGIVLLHPSGLTSKTMVNYATLLAQNGAVAIAIDAPYGRRGGTSVPLFTEQDRREQIQLMKDLQRAVDVLRARPDVDPARIGFEGYSYGGILGAQFVGIERRLKAAVLAAAHGGNVTGMTTTGGLSYLATQLSCGTRNAWFRAMVPIEPIRFIANAAPTELLFQMGRLDNAVLIADAQALADAASSPKDVRIYEAGHGLNQQALNERHDWWHAKLGIDARQ
jgi:dienelactone hydrolase